MADPTVIRVETAAAYDVVVGSDLLAGLPGLLASDVQRVAVVFPEDLPGPASSVTDVLSPAYDVLELPVPPGERAKTAECAHRCWEALGAAGLTRSDAVVTVGGGATTDLGGFVAATWLRGVRVLHVPTTLLGMVDAAVGGKTGVNTNEGKNLVGAFYPPAGVLCDLETLATLPREDLASGLAEVVKAGFLRDPAILDLIETDAATALDPTGTALPELVERAVRFKAEVVGADLRERGGREVLNYGHTLGHAIEKVEQFRWRHGDAVSVGLVYAAELSRLAGRLDDGLVQRHRDVLGSLGLPIAYRRDQWHALRDAMRVDKKTRGDVLRFVVLDGLASPGLLEGPDDALLEAAFALVT